MKTGELVGLVNTGGKPQELFTKFKNDQGYKFLSVPFDKFDDLYVPSVFTSEDYPDLHQARREGRGAGRAGGAGRLQLVTKENDRFRRIQRFIEYFVDRFEGFQKPPYHPAWKSINLSAKVPGWTRYWVAEEKLKQVAAAKPVGDAHAPGRSQLARQQAARAAPNDAAEQERLFQQFLEWNKGADQAIDHAGVAMERGERIGGAAHVGRMARPAAGDADKSTRAYMC